MKFQKLLNKLYEFINGKHFVIYLLVAILLTFTLQGIVSLSENSSKIKDMATPELVELDTFIPKDHTLLPIQLANHLAITSVLGSYGIIDLYKTINNQKRLVAENLKIFRAPKNPQKLYVLILSHQARNFLESSDLSFAVLKNKSHENSTIKSKQKTKRSISIGVQ